MLRALSLESLPTIEGRSTVAAPFYTARNGGSGKPSHVAKMRKLVGGRGGISAQNPLIPETRFATRHQCVAQSPRRATVDL